MALKKRELEAAADHFNREERDKLRKKWDAMDVEDAEEAMGHDITTGGIKSGSNSIAK